MKKNNGKRIVNKAISIERHKVFDAEINRLIRELQSLKKRFGKWINGKGV